MPDTRVTHSPITRRKVLQILSGVASGTLLSVHGLPVAARMNGNPATFLAAVREGNLHRVKQMLTEDMTLAASVDREGCSAYVIAKISMHHEIAELLRESGIELDIVEAVLAEDWDRVETLAKANPDIMNRAHPIGGNPLYASALVGGPDQYRIRSLGSDSNGRPSGGTGFTPARAAMDCNDPIGALIAATDILSNGGDVNAGQADGDSVLHGAVKAKDLRLVRLAIRKGANIDAQDHHGRSPRDLAEHLDWDAGVSLLKNVDGLERDYRGSRFRFNASREPFVRNPIDDVSQARQSEVTGLSHFNLERVRTLLSADPRLVHSISTDAELAIEACGHTGNRDIIRLHLDYGAPLSLPTAISLGDLEYASWLLKQDGRLVHERGPHDFPVMWYPAIGGGSVPAAQLLLDHGAPIEQESGGETALHWAALRERPELVAFLIERGANPEAIGYRQNRAGATPLQLARAKGNAGSVRVLEAV